MDGYRVSCLFNNGESRVIDFQKLFEDVFQVQEDDPAFVLLQDYEAFRQLHILGNTIGWENIGMYAEDEEGKQVFYPYDLDPLVLYEHSLPDPDSTQGIGLMIKQARLEAGLTQEQLAKKSGTSKHYISRVENSKADIELLTLKKIIEAGLGRRLQIEIK